MHLRLAVQFRDGLDRRSHHDGVSSSTRPRCIEDAALFLGSPRGSTAVIAGQDGFVRVPIRDAMYAEITRYADGILPHAVTLGDSAASAASGPLVSTLQLPHDEAADPRSGHDAGTAFARTSCARAGAVRFAMHGETLALTAISTSSWWRWIGRRSTTTWPAKELLQSLFSRRVDLVMKSALKPRLRERILAEAVRAA